MRFCTTHRACEWRDGICEVASVWPAWLPLNSPEPCTLVDALIIEKVDGEWPEWALTANSATGGWWDVERHQLDALMKVAQIISERP